MQSTFVSQNKMFELLKTPQRNVEFVSELLTNIYVEFFYRFVFSPLVKLRLIFKVTILYVYIGKPSIKSG